MNILFVPTLPVRLREQVVGRLPEHSVRFCSEDDPAYGEALRQAEVVMGVPRRNLDEAFFAAAPKLRLVQLLRKGTDKVDLDSARKREIQVETIGEATAPFVAEHTLAMVMSLGRALKAQGALVESNRWGEAKPWQGPYNAVDSTPYEPCRGIRGQTLGLIGFGPIAKAVAEGALALGMRVQATRRSSSKDSEGRVAMVPLEELISSSDYVSLHVPLTPETNQLLGRDQLFSMKRGAFLINTSRGQLVDEDALIEALDCGHLGGAALDTFVKEPPAADCPLFGRDNVLVTPHSAWLGETSWAVVIDRAVDCLGREPLGDYSK